MQDLQQKIQQHFEQQEVKEKFDTLVNQMFKDVKQREKFLQVFDLIKQGEFDILDLDRYMVEDMGIEKDNVFAFNDELFHETYIKIYFEIQDLYNEKHGLATPAERMSEETQEKEIKSVMDEKTTEKNLIQIYNKFINSSLFQNILAKQEQIKERYYIDNKLDEHAIKNEFYEAINAGDKIKLSAILRVFSELGIMRKMFKDDQRYIDFWAGYLNRHGRDKEGAEFLKDPANEKFLVEFLKFILEKRVGLTNEESVIIGVGLGALCTQKEEEYKDMAYGDEDKNDFVWKY